jgi:ketosteroid isomerase-like protein
MPAAKSNTSSEAQIRALIDERVKAVRARDVNGTLANVIPDVLVFDVINPLQYSGSDNDRKRTEEWFSSFRGPIGFEVRDLGITVSDDVAFSHCLNRYSGSTVNGQLDMWVRVTTCYRKIDGKRMITHEHQSVPLVV